jgi:hypothetical protein
MAKSVFLYSMTWTEKGKIKVAILDLYEGFETRE